MFFGVGFAYELEKYYPGDSDVQLPVPIGPVLTEGIASVIDGAHISLIKQRLFSAPYWQGIGKKQKTFFFL